MNSDVPQDGTGDISPLLGASYYDVKIDNPIPHGSDILNKACSIQFSYSNGSKSDKYSGTVFAWLDAYTIRVSSGYMNIEAAWKGANGGELSITGAKPSSLTRKITGFLKIP